MSRLLRVDEVMERTGLSRMTLWRRQRAGDFPSRVKISANCVAWHESEVEEWIASRPRAESNGQKENR